MTSPSHHADPRPGLPWLMLAAMLWGTVGISIRAIQSLTPMSGAAIGFWRLGLAAPLLWLLAWIALQGRLKPVQQADAFWMLLYGLMMALYQITTVGAIARVGVSVAILIAICLSPIVVVILSAIFLAEPLTPRIAGAGVMAIGGATCLVNLDPGVGGFTLASVTGWGLAMGAAGCYGVIVLCSRRLAGHYHPLQTLSVSFSVAALLLYPIVLMQGWETPTSGLGWSYLGYLAAIPTVLAYAIFLRGIRSSTATIASLMTLLEPLIATLLAWLFFGETWQPLSGVGALLLLGSVVVLGSRSPARD